jgi:hypothetical protein
LTELESRLDALSRGWFNCYFQKKITEQGEEEIFSDALEYQKSQEGEVIEIMQDQQAQILQPAYGVPGSSKS